jgi:hypothetical protein
MSADILVVAWYPYDEISEVAQIQLRANTTLPGYIKTLSAPRFHRTRGVD